MKRRPDVFDGTVYDLAVAGGGIYGACIARDAALRGLRVALVERGDFGGGTSHNSLKLIHGGFRYMQHLDLPRIRESMREQRHWLRVAPHLVRPLRFVIPAYGRGLRGPEALRVALTLYGLATRDRDRGLPVGQRLPAGRVVSADECRRLIPGVRSPGLRGGAVWYDAQMRDADRLLLECVLDAAGAGADVCNHVSADGLITRKGDVRGLRCRDILTGDTFELRARLTVNACGPWAQQLINAPHWQRRILPGLSASMNLVTRGVGVEHAFGVVSRRPADARIGGNGRMYFLTPWRGRTVVGTTHARWTGDPSRFRITERAIRAFLDEINEACPALRLNMDDLFYCYGGLTPAEGASARGGVQRSRRGLMLDHARVDGRRGLITVMGEKYTTARSMAERVVDLACRRLGRPVPACAARDHPLPGARGFHGMSQLRAEAGRSLGVGMTQALEELLESYGTGYRQVLDAGTWRPLRGDSGDTVELFRRRCAHAVDREMAVRLPDLIYRRTDLAARGLLTSPMVTWAAHCMAARLGWSNARLRSELSSVAPAACASALDAGG